MGDVKSSVETFDLRCNTTECPRRSNADTISKDGTAAEPFPLSPRKVKRRFVSSELLEEYLKAESVPSENDCTEEDNSSDCEEITDDVISTATSSLDRSVPINFATKTLPAGLSLRHSKLQYAVFGVFAERRIKRNTIFGPFVGVRIFDQHFVNNSDTAWKIFMNNKPHHYIDGENPETSNWMRYVNFAERAEEQNLESFQYKYKVYFRVTIDIRKHIELLVCSSKNYNQDGLNAGGELTELIENNTLMNLNGNECGDLEDTASDASSDTTIITPCESPKVATMTKTVEKKHKCHICNAAFDIKARLRRHGMIHTGERPYKCDLCDFATARNSYLMMHKRSHTGEKPFKCDVCGTAFAWKHLLRQHSVVHSGKKAYKCDLCDAAYSRNENLTQHKVSHTGGKPFKCQQCNMAFSQIINYREHTRIHKGGKPHKCNVCDAVFIQKSSLKKHSRRHTGEKSFKCDLCNAAYSHQSSLVQHKRKHTVEKPFKCNLCDAAYLSQKRLVQHERKHTGEKSFKCNVCAVGFPQSRTLKRHVETHLYKQPYKCRVCKVMFAKKKTLMKHLKIYADKETPNSHSSLSQDLTSKKHKEIRREEKPGI